ncbi:finTRIM family, member 86 isoform X1 [Phycodurus eques]|uniref:finTRIM family, member 86 isoform X1 n=1 Tax=Phycodurus eques TaxID=693459 RepID=UPI002ACD3B2C|nr:finTRIM family, member 86 isoform X1 [Phycodurus eques]XP_061537509.1 finTRIM family, member 86 isoform X1 [Phycodurus eques]
MASAWSEEDAFVCSVCLETLKDPATLPCGHSYCLTCIQSHWDKGNSKGQYSCPQCRQIFKPRPSLAKSTVLVEAMEKLRSNRLNPNPSTAVSSAPSSEPIYLELLPQIGPRQGSVYPQLPTVSARPCPQHNQPLDLFCHDDRECVCEVCCQQEHKGHCVLKPEDERKERQKELTQMQAEVERRGQETEKTLKELPNVARQHKALVQSLQEERLDLFSELVKVITLTGTQVGELLGTHERSFGSHIQGRIHRLEQEMVQLHWKGEELSRLGDMQDHICFLKNFLTVELAGPTGARQETIMSNEEVVIVNVCSALKELQESIKELCKSSLAKLVTLVNEGPTVLRSEGATAQNIIPVNGLSTVQNTVYETQHPIPLPLPRPSVSPKSSHLPPLVSANEASAPPFPQRQPQAPKPVTTVGLVSPEPKMREELLKFRFEPTIDPNTVYRHIRLSDGGHKATLRAENLNPVDYPERFHYWRQLLCREPLGGSPYYWEVEWTGQKITIGVAYKDMDRQSSDDKSRLGHNPLSWSLYWSGSSFSFWHNGQEKLLGSPKAKRIGTYLDQHAGILAFYRITNDQAHLIHRHETQFSGPLYPGFRFWSGVGATVTVCQLD